MTTDSRRTPTVTERDARDERGIVTAGDGPEAIVVWRGERIDVRDLPDRIARLDDRDERDRLLGAYLEALDALNPRWESRLDGRPAPADVAADLGVDPAALAGDLEGFILHTETPYYAALRRYLALIDIEQGDATVADAWHIARGTAWRHWFDGGRGARAIEAAGRVPGDAGGLEGWLATERMLRGSDAGDGIGPAAVGAAYASLVGSPEWVESELGMAAGEVVPYVDFAAFVRLWRVRDAIAHLQYELRLAGGADPDVSRVYYGGIVGHMTGVLVPEQLYLLALEGAPFAPAAEVVVEILGSDLVASLEARHGTAWWREPGAAEIVDAVGAATSVDDALARLGYDSLDWRPLLRQIRTRLIGEMSGYGGPNITTRAGTRKV